MFEEFSTSEQFQKNLISQSKAQWPQVFDKTNYQVLVGHLYDGRIRFILLIRWLYRLLFYLGRRGLSPIQLRNEILVHQHVFNGDHDYLENAHDGAHYPSGLGEGVKHGECDALYVQLLIT